jgi:proteasome lid subunit RPN8/RPN11
MRLERSLPAGESLLGYYHSHPTAAAVPSRFDRDVAWPFYTYVIVSLVAPVTLRAWRLTSDDGDFAEESVEPTPALR